MQEQEFKQLFLNLKRADQQLAPLFGKVMEAARSRPSGASVVGFRVAALAGLLVLATAGLGLLQWQATRGGLAKRLTVRDGLMDDTPPAELPWHSLVLASQWRSPTDFLLITAGAQWPRPASASGETSDNPDASARRPN